MFLPLDLYAQYCGCGLTTFAIELWPCSLSLIKWVWRVGALWSLQLKLSGMPVRLHSTGLEMSSCCGYKWG